MPAEGQFARYSEPLQDCRHISQLFRAMIRTFSKPSTTIGVLYKTLTMQIASEYNLTELEGNEGLVMSWPDRFCTLCFSIIHLVLQHEQGMTLRH